jgi:6-pyruvoyltetrahydropterin/6-carboxytetrahydropterin synthase
MDTYTCTKTFEEFPFAHRQHTHDGHCAFVHGHNWVFIITFGARQLDACGFVFDFGKMDSIEEWLQEKFDHTCLIMKNDPLIEFFKKAPKGIFNLQFVDDVSSEGLAKFIFENVDSIIKKETEGRCFVVKVEVREKQTNVASYHA